MAQDERERDQEGQLISLAALARRWQMSVTGAKNICERAGIATFYLGAVPRGTRRFRLRDIEDHERSVRA